MKKLFRKLLLGITLPTEYVTARRQDLPVSLKTVRTGGQQPAGLLFLGYQCPLLGIVNTIADGKGDAHSHCSFTMVNSYDNSVVGRFNGRSGPAIQLGKHQLTIAQCGCYEQFLELEIHQTNAGILSLFRKRRTGNIDLTKWEYDFLKLQYSTPREIRIAVVSDGDKYNLFPIDLYGFVGDEYMILSLRHQMNSCGQLESTGKVSTWVVDAKFAKEVYALGKYHGAKFRPANELPLSDEKSPVFKFPSPEYGIAVEEFELQRKIEPDFGHHRLFILKRVGNEVVPSENSLVHVHRAYAEWLLKLGFPLKQITR